MKQDILTIMWKEWREILLQRGTFRSGVLASVVLPLALLGIVLPWGDGRHWVTEPTTPILWIWLPVFMVATMICESFAGERERHTLESLLASRLPDRAILLGKIAAGVSYGWGLAVASLLLGVITVNVVHGHGEFLMLSANTTIVILVMSFVGSALAASAGVLISLRASTVRQAQQTLSLSLLLIVFGAMFGARALPAAWKVWLLRIFGGGNLLKTELAVGIVLLGVDFVLAAAAMARFQRARLIPD